MEHFFQRFRSEQINHHQREVEATAEELRVAQEEELALKAEVGKFPNEITAIEAEKVDQGQQASVHRECAKVLSKLLHDKDEERDVVGCELVDHGGALGMDGRALLSHVQCQPFAQWRGSCWCLYASLHSEVLGLASASESESKSARRSEGDALQLHGAVEAAKVQLTSIQSCLAAIHQRFGSLRSKTGTLSDLPNYALN